MGCATLFLWPFLLLKALFNGLRWCLTNGTKGLVVLGIAVVVSFILFLVISGAINNALNPESSSGIPSKDKAPYIVYTASRTYYAAKVEQKLGVTTLTTFWEQDGDKWVKYKILEMGPEFGKVKVEKRK